jgi:two-component system sensor histidine kinase YesM
MIMDGNGMKRIKAIYRRLPLAKKIFSLNTILIFCMMIVFTMVVHSFFERAVLRVASNGYIQKFEDVSEECTQLLSDAAQLTKVLCTDEDIEAWFLYEEKEAVPQYLKKKLDVEKRLDYIDTLYSRDKFSSISIYDSGGHMVNTNNIRAKEEVYQKFFTYISLNTIKPKWIDLYEMKFPGYNNSGIAYVRPYRDYGSGKIKGYIMIEYNSDILMHNFTTLKYGEEGKYVVADLSGNIKIYTDEIKDANISNEAYFKWAIRNDSPAETMMLQGSKYLVTAEMIPGLNWNMIALTPVEMLTRDSKAMMGTVYLLGAVAILICAFLSRRIAHNVTKPLVELSDTMGRLGQGELKVSVPIRSDDEIGGLERAFNKMTDEIQELITQVYSEQKAKRKLEFATLQAQINPHFLYNTMSSVSSLIKLQKPEEALAMLKAISQFYRTALSNGKTVISIGEELENINSYIQIQSTRYGDKIQYEIDMGAEVYNQSIVKLTLQPLVENAIYHGIKECTGKGIVKIKGVVKDEKIYISVSDNGRGMTKCQAESLLKNDKTGMKSSFGLYSVHQRLIIHFGEEYGLAINSTQGEGTEVTVIIPYIAEKREEQ